MDGASSRISSASSQSLRLPAHAWLRSSLAGVESMYIHFWKVPPYTILRLAEAAALSIPHIFISQLCLLGGILRRSQTSRKRPRQVHSNHRIGTDAAPTRKNITFGF